MTDAALARRIRDWGHALGLGAIGIADLDLSVAGSRLAAWLAAGHHGAMDYMARHALLRVRPDLLVPGARRALVARLDYLSVTPEALREALADPARAYVAAYALGRDYHKVLRRRLQRLAERIAAETGPFGHRVFVDSGPVLEKPLAERAGLGWSGRHTGLVDRHGGSWFFLGVILVDLDLPVDAPAANHCGRCRACLDACPTAAISASGWLDARRCIAYLTIEHPGGIPEPLRPLIGNRIHGCDDCQLACPWTRFARPTAEPDFQPRQGLDRARLSELFAWDEATFLHRTEGSALRRLGHSRWLRNLAVALGNAPTTPETFAALRARADSPDPLVREHVAWALGRHQSSCR